MLWLWLTSAHACAVCACGDPTLVVMGAEQPFAGRKRASVVLEHQTDAVGTPGVDQVTLTQTTATVGAAWSPTDRTQLAVTLPLSHREATDVTLATTEVWSPGDLTVRARFVELRRTHPRGATLAGVSGGLVLPTAPIARSPDGEALPLRAQLGTGHPAGIVGGWILHTRRPWSAYASSEVEFYGDTFYPDTYPSRPGPSVRATTMGQWQPRTWGGLRAGLEARIDAQQAVFTDAPPEPDTGGAIVFSRADVVASPTTDLLIQLSVSVPTVSTLRGNHQEGIVLAAGVTHDF